MLNKITLYTVVDKEKYNKHEDRFLTITPKKCHCEEFIDRLIRVECHEHFKAWCELRNIKQTVESWNKYREIIPEKYDKYYILKVKFDKNGIAAIFRMFNGCIPLGLSYDNPLEYANIVNKLPRELKDKLEEAALK